MWNNPDQGGGYVNSPGFGSPQQSQETRRPGSRVQTVLPCTIESVLKAQPVEGGDGFSIDGDIKVSQVTLVGVIREITQATTRIDYKLDDRTGDLLRVTQWVDSEEESPERETTPFRENTYVRIFGHIRQFNNQNTVVAFKMQPVKDPNEITTHILECIHNHMALSLAQGQGDTYMPPANNGMSNTMGGMGDFNDGGVSGLSTDQNQVLSVIKSCPNDTGFPVKEICGKLRGMSESNIRAAIDFLSSEGHIYSTIDDDHFKSTDAS